MTSLLHAVSTEPAGPVSCAVRIQTGIHERILRRKLWSISKVPYSSSEACLFLPFPWPWKTLCMSVWYLGAQHSMHCAQVGGSFKWSSAKWVVGISVETKLVLTIDVSGPCLCLAQHHLAVSLVILLTRTNKILTANAQQWWNIVKM